MEAKIYPKGKSDVPKVAGDLLVLQSTWSFMFVAIMLAVYLVFHYVVPSVGFLKLNNNLLTDSLENDFLDFVFRPSKVYMLIVGITSASGFLAFYVKHGITRKACFAGSAAASVAHAAALAVLAGIPTAVQHLAFPSSVPAEPEGYLDFGGNWGLALLSFAMNVLIYYSAGWLIGIGFYRFVPSVGMLFIPLALLLIVASDVLWEFELQNPLTGWLSFDRPEFTPLVSAAGTLVLFGAALAIIRACTKRAAIKIK